MRFTEFKEPDALQLTEQQQIVLDYCQGNITKEHAVQLLSKEIVTEAPKSFGQAFAQARKAHGGPGGMFTWNGKQYQTNIKGEPYVKNPTPVKFKKEKPPVRPPVDAGDNVGTGIPSDIPNRPDVDAGDNVGTGIPSDIPGRPPVDAGDNVGTGIPSDIPVRPPVDAGDNVDDKPDFPGYDPGVDAGDNVPGPYNIHGPTERPYVSTKPVDLERPNPFTSGRPEPRMDPKMLLKFKDAIKNFKLDDWPGKKYNLPGKLGTKTGKPMNI